MRGRRSGSAGLFEREGNARAGRPGRRSRAGRRVAGSAVRSRPRRTGAAGRTGCRRRCAVSAGARAVQPAPGLRLPADSRQPRCGRVGSRRTRGDPGDRRSAVLPAGCRPVLRPGAVAARAVGGDGPDRRMAAGAARLPQRLGECRATNRRLRGRPGRQLDRVASVCGSPVGRPGSDPRPGAVRVDRRGAAGRNAAVGRRHAPGTVHRRAGRSA